MSRTKIVTAVVVVLALGLLGTGVGLASFYLQDAQPPKGQPAAQEAKGGGAERLRKLLEKRRDVSRQEFEARKKELFAGQPNSSVATLFGAATRLLNAELALSKGRAARTATCKAHLGRMRVIEKFSRQRFEVGVAGYTRAVCLMAEFYALDAEIRVEEAAGQ